MRTRSATRPLSQPRQPHRGKVTFIPSVTPGNQIFRCLCGTEVSPLHAKHPSRAFAFFRSASFFSSNDDYCQIVLQAFCAGCTVPPSNILICCGAGASAQLPSKLNEIETRGFHILHVDGATLWGIHDGKSNNVPSLGAIANSVA